MKSKKTRSEEDSAWKDVLDAFFPQFIYFFFPWLAKQIDWSVGFEVLDKELQKITSKAKIGKRFVDKLVKVTLLSDEQRLILLHIEIQAVAKDCFSQRMFIYHYKLFDLYNLPILPLVILTDNDPNWRPNVYSTQVVGIEVLNFRFEVVKLLDFMDNLETLQAESNIFAVVVSAQLVALKTKKNKQSRFTQKIQLTKRLISSGRNKEEIYKLYSFIDWAAIPAEYRELKFKGF